MANLIAVASQTGTGKSTSLFPNPELGIIGLNPKETFFINVAKKPLPVAGFLKMYPDTKISEGGNYAEVDTADPIVAIVNLAKSRDDIKNVVIDD